jgi:hypothetical protein
VTFSGIRYNGYEASIDHFFMFGQFQWAVPVAYMKYVLTNLGLIITLEI